MITQNKDIFENEIYLMQYLKIKTRWEWEVEMYRIDVLL